MKKTIGKTQINRQGFGIIEILITILIISIALFSLLELYSFYIRVGSRNVKQLQAVSLAQEAMEATRSVKDESWNNISGLALGAAYYPAQSAGPPAKWILNSGQQSISGFTRQVVFSKVYRDINDNIIDIGGTEDTGSRKVTADVFWQDGGTSRDVKLVTYLMNWK